MMLAEQYFSAESFTACATRLGSSPLGVLEQVVTPANTQRAQAPESRRGFVQRFLGGKRENGDPRRICYTCMTFVVPWRYSMLAIRLPESIEARLNALAQETGRAKSTLAREAILEYIDDLEDYYLAEARARMNRNTIPLADVERELGL
jgi:RHH-type rel operon transcriptional repressor/antitoxin RelB